MTRRPVLVAVITVVVVATAFSAGARQTPETPPPTPVNGKPSPFPTSVETPANAVRPPVVDAAGALLADLGSGTVLVRKASEAPRPIASLTKIMTALVVLEDASLDEMVVVDPAAVYERGDYGASSTLGLRAGERIAVEDLLYALMLGSANDAAEALAIHVDGSVEAFVDHMNRRAAAIGMADTRFSSASGLDDRGRSTPSDLLRLVRVADRRPVLRSIVAARFHRIEGTGNAPDRRVQNRNVLLWLYPGAQGMKTGFTSEARACLVAIAERDGRRLVSIVLGAPDEAFSDAASMLNHGFEGYEEETLVLAGEPLGELRIRGGTVPVVAGGELTVLLPKMSLHEIDQELVADPEAAFPPPAGATVGTLRLRGPASILGTVPLVADVVPAAPAEEGPWWGRTAATVGRALVDALGALAD